ncbi:hypothetical protein [Flavobacterium sp. RS13.1]|uniref:hypothetical protein n=1 Tax=Flavobacterium sp. RS13.1 TaxID=3400345 RepID=UPI003AAADAF6
MKTTSSFFLLISLLNISFSFSQSYSLKDFEVSKIPKMDSKEWYDLNHSSDKTFVFSLESGKIKIEKYQYSPHVEYDIPSGKLIAVNMGEFGGGLYFKPKDTTQTVYVNGKNAKEIKPRFFGGLMIPDDNPIHNFIKDSKLLQSGNFQFIFGFNDSIYLLGGLAHMSLNFGNLFSLRNENESFFISETLKLDDAPSAMCVHKNFIYIAGNKGFYILDKNLQKTTLFNDLFWYGLYPASVVVLDEKNVFVTIRGGYVKINTVDKKLQFYKAK